MVGVFVWFGFYFGGIQRRGSAYAFCIFYNDLKE